MVTHYQCRAAIGCQRCRHFRRRRGGGRRFDGIGQQLADRQHQQRVVAADPWPVAGAERHGRQAAHGAGLLGEPLEIVRSRRLCLERCDAQRDRQHVGQPRELLEHRAQTFVGRGIAGHGALENLEVHDRRVERAAEVVQEPGELGGQRTVRGPSGRARHQVRRADFTAWMPYFASLL